MSHPSSTSVPLSEVLSALSHALDLTEGQPIGHAERTCLIGMRLAEELGLSSEDRSALYYALLLKDAGCSSNASKMAALFAADDRVVKPRMKVVDWHRKVGLAFQTARNAGLGGSLVERVRTFVGIARSEHTTRDLIQLRCDRGAMIAGRLGFPAATADAIRSLDEHWCGLGYARGLAGEEIPLLARICNIAQTVEAFHADRARDAALRVVRQRRGTWFDPRLADIVQSWRRDDQWWQQLRAPDVTAQVVALEPASLARTADDEGLDEVARAFGDIVDAKSPYTYQHSSRVADVVLAMARHVEVGADEERRIYRAGLLHDIGKLGVSNRILDKPGKLDTEEWVQMQTHPRHTLSILRRVGAFDDFAWTAALHHEKLDGSGYPFRLGGRHLDQAARMLAVADIYDALTSDRPYRAGMTREAALGIIERDRGRQLCGESIDVLAEVTSGA